VDLVGIGTLRETLDRHGVDGVELRRGVEDEAAFERGINNQVTARGLVQVLRRIEDGALSADSSERMLMILHDQEFRSGIPAGLPAGTRVANKTGEISTVAHDAGLVYPPGRPPYALALLTEWDAGVTNGRRETIAALSRAVYLHLHAADA
jgi:beta-lactamase class A